MNDLLLYLALFVAALIPWFELFAIPPSIALGVGPIAAGLIAFVGNALATVVVIVGWARLSDWWERRRGRPLGFGSRGSERGRRVFERFGVPGLALQGPVISGIYFGALLALALGATRRNVLLWSLISIALWTVALVAGTMAGVSLIT